MIVIAFQCFFKTEQRLNIIFLFIINHSLVVMNCRRKIFFIKWCLLKVSKRFGKIWLFIKTNSPFLVTNVTQISLYSLSKSLDSLIKHFHFDFTCAFTKVCKAFLFVENYCRWEVLFWLFVHLFLQQYFPTINKQIIVIRVKLQPFRELNLRY